MKILAIITMLFCAYTGYSQNKNYIDQPLIETQAVVDTLVTPDEIYLTIAVSESDTKGKTSVEELETKMVQTLKSLGINTEKDLSLNDLASNFKKYFLKGQDVLKAKVYTLKVSDAQMAGSVILGLEKIDISNVELERTGFSKMKELELELRSLAIKRAKEQALSLVDPLGQKVGAAIYISDQSNRFVSRTLQSQASGIVIRGESALNEAEYKPADIEFEKIKIEIGVFVKFKLEE